MRLPPIEPEFYLLNDKSELSLITLSPSQYLRASIVQRNR